jgi:CheY-like chemotaxis protein
MGLKAVVSRTVSVLSVEPGAEDRDSLMDIFTGSNWNLCPNLHWELRSRNSVESAVSELVHSRNEPTPIVLCEGHVGWRQMLRDLQQLQDPPYLIVTSRLADDCLWAEALNLGAHDVLAKPFDRSEVVRVMSLAWLKWQEKHEPAAHKEFAAGASSAAGRFSVGSSRELRNRAGAIRPDRRGDRSVNHLHHGVGRHVLGLFEEA